MPCGAFVQAQGNHYVSSVPYGCYSIISLP